MIAFYAFLPLALIVAFLIWLNGPLISTRGEGAWPASRPPQRFMRDGGHGIHAEDWRETLDFLGAHLGKPR